jgi:hypothetical protein
MRGQGVFAVMNHVINPVIAGVLRSPLHGVASRHLLLLTLRARRSGRRITIPVGYEEVGANRLKVTVGAPERKRWWRNLQEEAPVSIRLRGRLRTGVARTVGTEQSGMAVEIRLS